MTGKLIGVGVGPGDPELMTIKAVRMIRENEVIAVPGEAAKESVAYQIAVQAAPELAEKELIKKYMEIYKEPEELEKALDISRATLNRKLLKYDLRQAKTDQK